MQTEHGVPAGLTAAIPRRWRQAPRLHFPNLGLLSLRSKLILALSVMALFSLGLAGSSFIFQVRDYQRQERLNQLADLAVPLAWQVRLLEESDATRDQLATFLSQQAAELNLRILLLDQQGVVIEDTGGSLVGQDLHLGLRDTSRWRFGSVVGTVIDRGTTYSFVVAPTPERLVAVDRDGVIVRGGANVVAIAVPEQTLAEAWFELAPSLGAAGLLALVVSIGVALMIAGSVVRPVTAMTRAAEEMARGNYDQTIPHRGGDEIARLAQSFNTMAREVGRSERLLRDFLANVSHELKTPLTSIQGFAQAMIDGTIRDVEGYAAAGRVVFEESTRMRRLVDDLLYLSTLEAGQITLSLEPFDLAAMLRAQPWRIDRQVQQMGVRLRVEVPDGLAVVGDQRRIEQVVANLLDNAVRWTPPDGTITLAGARTRRGVEVRVHNTGSYIPPDQISRIFDRFYQVEPSRSGEGSGLGLAIVREIVHAHRGSIEVRSDPESGTEFVVTFHPHLTKL